MKVKTGGTLDTISLCAAAPRLRTPDLVKWIVWGRENENYFLVWHSNEKISEVIFHTDKKNKIILFPPFSCRGSFKGRENKSERFSSTNLRAFLHFSSEFSKLVNFWKKNLATRFKFALTVTTIYNRVKTGEPPHKSCCRCCISKVRLYIKLQFHKLLTYMLVFFAGITRGSIRNLEKQAQVEEN